MIDEYWTDITVYYVEFTVKTDFYSNRKYGRTLAFNSFISKKEITHLITVYLKDIDEVLFLDVLEDALLLKKPH